MAFYRYDSQCITFIASKTDDVSCSEVVRALRLTNDPVYKEIQGRIKDVKKRQAQANQKKNEVAQVWNGITPSRLSRMLTDKMPQR